MTQKSVRTTTRVRVVVRYFAVASIAAGHEEELLAIPAGSTVGLVLQDAAQRLGPALAAVLPECTVLVDGVPDRTGGWLLVDGATVDVLGPLRRPAPVGPTGASG
ncbi:MoaD/ThiS family protein [Cellulomonas hominis]